jgi:hypothetical protein
MLTKIDGSLICSLRNLKFVVTSFVFNATKCINVWRTALPGVSRKILRHFWRDWLSFYGVILYHVWNIEVQMEGGCGLFVGKHPPLPRRRLPDFMSFCAAFSSTVRSVWQLQYRLRSSSFHRYYYRNSLPEIVRACMSSWLEKWDETLSVLYKDSLRTAL